MNQQRIEAYLNLIEKLLTCPSGEESAILNQHQDLIDEGLVITMQSVAQNMTENNDENRASFLLDMASALANYLGKAATPDYQSFLIEVLKAISESNGNPQVVYPLLQQNLDKLDLTFAQQLKEWATATFKEVPSETAQAIAGDIVNFGNLINQFPLGRRALNLEIGIACYQASLEVYTREAFPQDWAMTQNNLANAYSDRIKGEKADNIEDAIACYQASLEVRTREAFPQDSAMTQNNLANAYRNRIKGEKADNIEDAIKGFRLALEIYTPEAFPLYCLKSGRNLGNLCFKEGNWLVAIEGYQKAIEAVETSRSWATSDNSRQEILAASISVYENLIQAYINNNEIDKALEIVDRSRAKRLVDLMASNDLYAGEIPPEVEKYLQEFEAKQREIDSEIEKLRHPSNENKKELAGVGSQLLARAAVEAYSKKIEELEDEKQEIWKKIRKEDPVLAGQIKVNPIEFAAMQNLIPSSNTAILCFYTTKDDIHIFVIYNDKSPQLHTCPGEGYGLQTWIFENWLNPYLNDKTAWQEGMSDFLLELGKRLKINDLIGQYLDGIEELIIIPHVYLHQIPFADTCYCSG